MCNTCAYLNSWYATSFYKSEVTQSVILAGVAYSSKRASPSLFRSLIPMRKA